MSARLRVFLNQEEDRTLFDARGERNNYRTERFKFNNHSSS